jgi:hypothetical protein
MGRLSKEQTRLLRALFSEPARLDAMAVDEFVGLLVP